MFDSRKRAVDERGGDAAPGQTVHLVFHQRYKRRDDEGETIELQRGELKDERFPRPGGHDGERVMTCKQAVDGFGLAGAEGGEAEVGEERREEVGRHGSVAWCVVRVPCGRFLL